MKHAEYTRKTDVSTSEEFLDQLRKKNQPTTWEDLRKRWREINSALWGEVDPGTEIQIKQKSYDQFYAGLEAREAEEDARSATQENRERQLRVNDFVAFIVLIVVVVFLFYFFCRIFYIKVLLPFLDWCEKVAIWFENNQTAIFFWVGGVILFLICYRIFPVVKPKK